MKNLLIIPAVFALVLGLAYYVVQQEQTSPPVELPAVEVPRGVPTFTWVHQEDTTQEIPYTEISLTALYENGTSDTQIIERVEGHCNAYENADSDIYERSTMSICYYAGLGRYFKVVENEEVYLVQRRVFEEASPEYNPPQQPYETVAQF